MRAIEDVLQRYFDALYFADADTMEDILHPGAIYATADEAEPLIRNVPNYLSALRARVSTFIPMSEPIAASPQSYAGGIGSAHLVRANLTFAANLLFVCPDTFMAELEEKVFSRIFVEGGDPGDAFLLIMITGLDFRPTFQSSGLIH